MVIAALEVIMGLIREFKYSLLFSLCSSTAFFCYYLCCAVKKPKIICGGEKLRKNFLERHCGLARERYWPTWWCFGGRAQTVVRSLLQSSPPVTYETEFLPTADGGQVKLDWVENDQSDQYPKATRPTVLLLPGLTGSSKTGYMSHMVNEVTDLGYRCVVFSNRGVDGCALKTPRMYCAADSSDTELVVNHIKDRYPNAPLVGAGISMGGVLLYNYLANTQDAAKLDAVFAFSPTYDFRISTPVLETFLNYWLFNWTLLQNLFELLGRTNKSDLKHHYGIDSEHVLKGKTLRDFDDNFVCKMFGFKNAFDYYGRAALTGKVQRISRTLICLSAADDPFAPESSIPVSEIEQNENVAIILTTHGGHIGFLEGMFPLRQSYFHRWLRQLLSAYVVHVIEK